ncbi:hypothetical protein LI328DRAFT_61447 [Trichoderma asperelloides]|nr:hypothetical protein LI328DRAFT_61447 [Trichoderma asperelloides]
MGAMIAFFVSLLAIMPYMMTSFPPKSWFRWFLFFWILFCVTRLGMYYMWVERRTKYVVESKGWLYGVGIMLLDFFVFCGHVEKRTKRIIS